MSNLVKNLIANGPRLISEAMEYSKPRLAIFLKYAKVELIPPTPGEIPEAINSIKKLIADAKAGKWKGVKIKDAWLNTLVSVEVVCWFYIGECIGKRNLVGYRV